MPSDAWNQLREQIIDKAVVQVIADISAYLSTTD